MTERTYRTFTSWDEISPGDTLLWITNGRYRGTKVEFISFSDPISGPPSLRAGALEVPEEEEIENYSDDDWAACIYPNTEVVGAIGWALEGFATFKYDPTQQPEDDSI